MSRQPTAQKRLLSDGDTFEHRGHMFTFQIEPDEDTREPWLECDGRGIVSDWTSRPKLPGERILNTDHGSYRYYDMQGTVQRAIKDGWSLHPDKVRQLEQSIGRKPTKRQITEAAVQADYEWLRAWCHDEWSWVGVVVTLLKADADADGGYFETKHQQSLWGIESDSDRYLSDVGYELADEIISEVFPDEQE